MNPEEHKRSQRLRQATPPGICHLPVESASLAWMASGGCTITRTAAWSGLPTCQGTIMLSAAVMPAARQGSNVEQGRGVVEIR
ncbi:hypothetical protein WJX77_004807 [Trebouxia sp. C0004]